MTIADSNTHREGSEPTVRLDIWLWAARFFKTRSLAKQAIESGKVAVNGAAGKAAKPVRAGDRLTITRALEVFEIEVRDVRQQRTAASIAQTLYAETPDGRGARLAGIEQRRLSAAGYLKPPTKPDKRARRLIRMLGDIDAL